MNRAALAVVAALLGLFGASAAAAQAVDDEPAAPAAFSGATQGYGAGVTMNIPKGPLADELLDLTAPVTSANLDSLGSSVGFAAFPSPGELALSVPGLVSGLVAQGAAGLPPIDLPSLPNYPLAVRADASTPEASIGDGPYRLHAASSSTATSGQAEAGLQLDALGNLGLATSSSSIEVDGDSVTATSTAVVQGVSIGPLVIGEIKTTSAVTSSGDGDSAPPSSSVEITGARIAGIPVTIDGDGINIAGAQAPLPIGSTLTGILEGAGLDVEVFEASQTERSAKAEGLRIIQEIPTPGVGTGAGTVTISLAFSEASLADPGSLPADLGTSSPGTASGAPDIDLVSGGAAPLEVGNLPSPAAPALEGAPAPVGSPSAETAIGDVTLTGLSQPVDLRAIYLIAAALLLTILSMAVLIRFLGVRPI